MKKMLIPKAATMHKDFPKNHKNSNTEYEKQ